MCIRESGAAHGWLVLSAVTVSSLWLHLLNYEAVRINAHQTVMVQKVVTTLLPVRWPVGLASN